MNDFNNYELYHYGIKGMKWGVRRFQSKDGSLTPAGKKRYDAYEDMKEKKAAAKKAHREYDRAFNKAYNLRVAGLSPFRKHRLANEARWQDAIDKGRASNDAKTAYKQSKKNYRKATKAEKEAEEKDFRNSLNKHYKNDVNYYLDMQNYGKRGVERISKRMDKGMSSVKAETIEVGRTAGYAALNTMVAIGGVFAMAYVDHKRS